MRLEIINLNTNNDIDDAFEMVFSGTMKYGANVLMKYTYQHAIVYDDKVYIDMYKAMDYIAEDFSVSDTEDAYYRVNMIDERPCALTLYIEGMEEKVMYFQKVIL